MTLFWGFPLAGLSATFSGGQWTMGAYSGTSPWDVDYGLNIPNNRRVEAMLLGRVNEGELPTTLLGQSFTFSGHIVSNTLVAPHKARIFVSNRDYDYYFNNEVVINAPASGNFSVTLPSVTLEGLVEYGIIVDGPNLPSGDIAAAGKIVIGPELAVPSTKSSWSRVKSLYR